MYMGKCNNGVGSCIDDFDNPPLVLGLGGNEVLLGEEVAAAEWPAAILNRTRILDASHGNTGVYRLSCICFPYLAGFDRYS